jgi:septum formation protein
MGYDSIVLASASARRSQLLHQIGVRHRVVAADIDESPKPGERPADYVQRLAQDKAQAVVTLLHGRPDRPVLAADTTVVQDSRIFGKPADEAACVAMLGALAGRTHQVLTAITLWDGGQLRRVLSTSHVSFREIDADDAGAIGRAASRQARRAPMQSRAGVQSSSRASRAVFPG